MKLIGPASYNANETTTVKTLSEALLLSPEISYNIPNLFEKHGTVFSSYLARKGYSKKGLFPDFSSPNFKVIGNRKFKWALRGFPFRKGKLTRTPESPAGYTELGKNISEVYIYTDTKYFSPNDVLELADRRTLVWVLNEYPEETQPNEYRYTAKLVTKDKNAYIPDHLVQVGSEIGFHSTLFPEGSETGYEKNTFHEWYANTMCIQRMSYSITGSAKASKLAVSHNGVTMYTTEQELEMLKRWAIARENQLLTGRATVDMNTDAVTLKDLKGRDIISGDGIIHQGAESLKYQYNNLSLKHLERIMANIQLGSETYDDIEILCIGGQAFIWNFQRLMRDVYKFNPMPLFSEAGGRGVDSTFEMYKIGGVKLITAWNPGFDAAWKPDATDFYGTNIESHRAMFVGLGKTIGGDANIEMVALGNGEEDRSFIKRAVSGMVGPAMSGSGRVEVASSGVDAMQVHVISETGVKVGNPYSIAELYKPIPVL